MQAAKVVKEAMVAAATVCGVLTGEDQRAPDTRVPATHTAAAPAVYAASRPPPSPSPSPQLPYTRPYSSVDVVPFGAPFMDRGKVPQCPETGTKFRVEYKQKILRRHLLLKTPLLK